MNDDPPPQQPNVPTADPEKNRALEEADLLHQGPAQGLARQNFRFLTDHNVPDSVGSILIGLGHDVVRLRDVMAANATDPVVAEAAIRDSRVLISWDRDFNQQRFMAPRFAELSRLSMSGPEMDGAARLEAIFDVVAFALCRAAGAPITIRVGVAKVQIHV